MLTLLSIEFVGRDANGQMIAQGPCTLKQPNMAFMQQIECPIRNYFLQKITPYATFKLNSPIIAQTTFLI